MSDIVGRPFLVWEECAIVNVGDWPLRWEKSWGKWLLLNDYNRVRGMAGGRIYRAEPRREKKKISAWSLLLSPYCLLSLPSSLFFSFPLFLFPSPRPPSPSVIRHARSSHYLLPLAGAALQQRHPPTSQPGACSHFVPTTLCSPLENPTPHIQIFIQHPPSGRRNVFLLLIMESTKVRHHLS